MSKKYNRRKFIQQFGSGCAGIGATTLLSSLTNLGLISSAAAANSRNTMFAQTSSDYKALVCIMLAGGNDSFNMLIPRGVDEYADYAATRGDLAIPREELLAINPKNISDKEFGINPSMPKTQSLFEAGNLSFISNVGTLAEPTNLTTYGNGLVGLPEGLFSHSDQQQHWYTSMPDNRNAVTGWAGRMADILQSVNENQNISMNISIGGTLFGTGSTVQSYPISDRGDGAILLDGANNNGFYESLKRQTFDSLLEETYANTLRRAYVNTVKNSTNNSFEFSSALSGVTTSSVDYSGGGDLGTDLQMIARSIAARDTLGMSKQTFFSRTRGWDHHANFLEVHAEKLTELDNALKAFYDNLVELGVENNVTTFVVSDFGRTLTSNGSGTDHAWGGNVLVMGGAVDGQQILGQYPDLFLGNDRDLGRGRLIPTTSTDEYFAELALWFGASSSDLDQILPNINRFWTPTSVNYPIGFMS